MATSMYPQATCARPDSAVSLAVLERLGIGEAPVLSSRSFKRAQLSAMRLKSERDPDGQRVQLQTADAWVVHLHLNAMGSRKLWVDRRPTEAPPCAAGSTVIYDLTRDLAIGLGEPIDALRLHLPRTAIEEVADELGGPRKTRLNFRHGEAMQDRVVQSLAHSILFAIEKPDETNTLFVDHIALAFRIHIARTYAGLQFGQHVSRGRLAAWQERRAKDLLEASITTDVSLADVAEACGLSPSYFARAFRQNTGEPPYRWLMKRRIVRAKELLASSSDSLVNIGLACGFADQSHFGRVFVQLSGMSPGAWRRWRNAPALNAAWGEAP